MKHAVKLYRILKPVAVYTSYLFTVLTVLYLAISAAGPVFDVQLPFTPGVLWAFFFFSLGSMILQRVFFHTGLCERLSYPVRFVLYTGSAALWGGICLYAGNMVWLSGPWSALVPALGAGILCCIGLELFNRRRARMYNLLLQQYKKRRT